MKIILIRHGKTKGNIEARYIGKRSDEELCMEGIEELRDFVLKGKYPKANLLFSSPMKRAIQSAAIIYKDMCPIILDGFYEMDFGDFEGKNYQELSGNLEYQKWIDEGGSGEFPNAESKADFSKRVYEAFIESLEMANDNDKTQIAYTIHGGCIMAIMTLLLGGNIYDYMVKNGEGYILDIEYSNGVIEVKDYKKL